MDIKTIDKRIKQAFNTVRQGFRGKVARVQAGGGVQKIQVEGLDGETVQDLEHAENFGFTSNPPAGSDCVVVPLGVKPATVLSLPRQTARTALPVCLMVKRRFITLTVPRWC